MQRLTVQRVMLIVLFILLLTIATRIPVDTDTWWHLRSGEHTLTQGMIYTDPFSHTFEGERWINHSWGSQIVMLVAWNVGGDLGLALYTSILATVGMAFLYRIMAGNVYLKAFILILTATTASVFWSARPQMMSFMFSTIVLYLLYLYKREDIDRLWWIVPLMVVWGNLHAGFSIGYIFLGAVIVGESLNRLWVSDKTQVMAWAGIRKLVFVTIVSVPLLMINPYGFEMLRVPFETVSIGSLRDFIQEWNSPNFQERQTWAFVAMMVLLFGSAWGSRLKFDWSSFFLVSGTFFMALLAGRNIAVFAVVAAPVLSYHAHDILQARGWVIQSRKTVSLRVARINLLLIVIIGFGAFLYLLGAFLPESVDEAQAGFLPVDAANYMGENQPEGTMFNSYNWGGYLMFAVPEYPVFIDGRTDLYTEFFRDWLVTATGDEGWRDLLTEFDINLVVVENGSGLDMNLREEPGWQLDYEDEMAVIWVRTEAGS